MIVDGVKIHHFESFEAIPLKELKIGDLVLAPSRNDVSINDVYLVIGIDDKGDSILEICKPTPKQLVGEELWSALIMEIIQYAKNDKKDLYRETKKEIKRLMLEDKEARAFFQKTIGAIGSIKI